MQIKWKPAGKCLFSSWNKKVQRIVEVDLDIRSGISDSSCVGQWQF